MFSWISNFTDLTSVHRTTLPPWVVNHATWNGSPQAGDIGYSEENTINCKSKMMSSLWELCLKTQFYSPKASLLKHLLRILIPLANLVNTHGYLLYTEQGICYQDWCVCLASAERSGVDYGEEGGQLKSICLNREHLWASFDILCLMTISRGPAGKDTLWEVALSISPKATSWPVLKWLENMIFLQISFFQASVYFIFLKFSGLVSLESQHSWSPPPVPACLNWDGTLSCFLRALAKSLGISLLFISWEFSIKHVLSLPVCQRKKKSFFPWHEYWIIFIHKGILYWCLTNDWKDQIP